MEDRELFIDPIVKPLLDRVKNRVEKKDFDHVQLIDGDNGTGKSVLAMQLAKYLDPNFSLDNVHFTAKDFIEGIKKAKPHTAIILDEGFQAANSRAAMTEVNRGLIAVATEMRQQNLFIFIILPSFFDLDKYFALHRCSSLMRTYLTDNDDRGQYIIFPREQKKLLYILGKKYYDYSKPTSPYPPCRFYKHYVVDEKAYRLKKNNAFTDRKVGIREQKAQAAIEYAVINLQKLGYTHEKIGEIVGYARQSVTDILNNEGIYADLGGTGLAERRKRATIRLSLPEKGEIVKQEAAQ